MITTYFKNLIANNLWHTAGDASSELPSAYYLALSSTPPSENGSGVTEPQHPDYQRKRLEGLSAASNGVTRNSGSLGWSRFTTSAGSVTYWVLYDAVEGGNVLMWGALDSPKHLDAGTTLVFDAGSIELSVLGE